jgi:hypothetical protein
VLFASQIVNALSQHFDLLLELNDSGDAAEIYSGISQLLHSPQQTDVAHGVQPVPPIHAGR